MQINPAALTAIRQRSGLTQIALGERSGVSQNRISDLEAGEQGRPVNVRPSTAKALADALGVPIVALLATPTEVEA